MTGQLCGIGVGPGDPELLTLKAARLLVELPVIAYPAPSDGDSTARMIAASFIAQGRTEIAIRIPMRPGSVPAVIYDRAAEEIAAHLDAGRDVGVLCEGDPFFYGTFMYLYERLTPRFPATVVPGVTSLTACAAASGRPLVARDGILVVLPATLSEVELERELSRPHAAAVMKVGRHLARVRGVLTRLGRLSSATYVAHATRGDQRVAPLADLDEPEAPYFSMILVAGRQA